MLKREVALYQKFWVNLRRKLVYSLIGFEGRGDNSEIFEHNLRIVVKIFPAVSSCGGAIQNTCSHRTVRVGKRVLCRNKISQNFSFTRGPPTTTLCWDTMSKVKLSLLRGHLYGDVGHFNDDVSNK